MALAAKVENGKFILDLFLNYPDQLVSTIEGGMADSRFNTFVIRSDNHALQYIGCSFFKKRPTM